VLPSIWDEPFGRVVVETLATGRPMIGCAVGGIAETVHGDLSDMLYPRGDAAALAEWLRKFQHWRRDDPGLADRCVERVQSEHSMSVSATRWEALFNEARGRRAGR
jgi:glycosyltransferase involved in cell wall biosynthesis